MGKNLRFLALLFIATPLSAMLVEPFFERLFDALGWDTEDWAAPFLSFLSGVSRVTELPFFWPPAYIAIGLGVGVWLHFFATKRDKSKADYRSVGADGWLLAMQVREALNRFSLPAEDGDPLLMACYAHFVNMRKVGLMAPSPPKDYDPRQFLDVSAQFMAAYYEVSSRSTKREAIGASEMLASRYQSLIS